MPPRTPVRPRDARPAAKPRARITDAFYRRMTANPAARIPYMLTER